ncbi:MAG: hypothetical protein QM727_15070 [Niabella sp.]
MNWKICIAGFISLAIAAVPKNIIGCGPGIDPYDYYISFFNQYNGNQLQYKPFFYTNASFLYDFEEPVSAQDRLVDEWRGFTGNTATNADVNEFVMCYARKDVYNLYNHLEKKTPLNIPDSVSNNSMTAFFKEKKDLEALGYILYAKQVEPFVTVSYNQWDTQVRDSITMNKLLKNGIQLYKAAKTDLFRLKYGYQIVRLAHYNQEYENAIQYYDEMVAGNPTKSVLQPMSLALKAGALYWSGKRKEAAYLFSKVFDMDDVNKISNYYGFDWAVVHSADKEDYLALCKNKDERAAMLGLFSLNNPYPDLTALKELYTLKPNHNLFTTLLVREVNKYEENFLTPLLQYEQTGSAPNYLYFRDGRPDSIMNMEGKHLKEFKTFLETEAPKADTYNAALMRVAAAYSAYMLRDLASANENLSAAKKMKLTERLQDQWMLTNLLVNISEASEIDAGFEEKILPSLQWLLQKLGKQREDWWYNGGEQDQWSKFYNNVFLQVLAPRYRKQGDLKKELFCIGAAARAEKGDSYAALEFLRNRFNGAQTEDLYNFLTAGKFTDYEKFLLSQKPITVDAVTDFAGTGYLRDAAYDKAITWLSKSGKVVTIEKDPFIELPYYDREERLPKDNVTTTKLAFAKEMKRLNKLAETDKNNAAKHLYKVALGYYNTTYYGYAWELVEYYRSGADGYFIPKDATSFQREYYGAYRAHDYFKKAMEASRDKEFQAKCLFMMAKCSQKQIAMPQYTYSWGDDDYKKYEMATKKYDEQFRENIYFPQLIKSYGDTKFFKEAESRCSYLSDFVKAKRF